MRICLRQLDLHLTVAPLCVAVWHVQRLPRRNKWIRFHITLLSSTHPHPQPQHRQHWQRFILFRQSRIRHVARVLFKKCNCHEIMQLDVMCQAHSHSSKCIYLKSATKLHGSRKVCVQRDKAQVLYEFRQELREYGVISRVTVTFIFDSPLSQNKVLYVPCLRTWSMQ